MAKTKEELNELKKEFEVLTNQLRGLTDEELMMITGGIVRGGTDAHLLGDVINPARFDHPVVGTYKKESIESRKDFQIQTGGGTGKTLHPDNMTAGPSSYGMSDTLDK